MPEPTAAFPDQGGSEKLERGIALCLSGGGIRSATFGLGLLQGLARKNLLARFDYLSTVSGGGYIGAWLSAWAHRGKPGDGGIIDASEMNGVDVHVVGGGTIFEPLVVGVLEDHRNGAQPGVAGRRGAVPERRGQRRRPVTWSRRGTRRTARRTAAPASPPRARRPSRAGVAGRGSAPASTPPRGRPAAPAGWTASPGRAGRVRRSGRPGPTRVPSPRTARGPACPRSRC